MEILHIIACYCLLLFTCNVEARNEHILALYGNDQSELLVTDTELRQILKIFTVQAKSTSGVTLVYDKDLIFFSDYDGTIYRIHLVDDKGNRQISGNGSLFTNQVSEHFEMMFYEVGHRVIDLAYDKQHQALYAITTHAIFTLDPNIDPDEPENALTKKIAFSSALTGKHAIINRGMLYLADSHNLFSVPLAALSYSPRLTILAKFELLTSFAIDTKSSKLFYVSRNVMRVIGMNLSGEATIDQSAIRRRRVVLANSGVTKGVYSMAVYGDVVVWSSCPWRELYIGKLNYKKNFIPMRNVYLLDSMMADDEDDEDCIGFHNINLFLHNYDGDDVDGDKPSYKVKKKKAKKVSKKKE